MATRQSDRVSRPARPSEVMAAQAAGNEASPASGGPRWRLWAVAAGVGAMCGLAGAAFTWMLLPPLFTATAKIQVLPRQSAAALPGQQPSEPADPQAEILKDRQAQAALAASDDVLKAALGQTKVAELSIVAGQRDPVGWLRAELAVGFPGNGDVLQMQLSGQEVRQTVKLLDAVKAAYLDAAIRTDRDAAQQLRFTLEQQYAQCSAAVNQRMDQLLRDLTEEQFDQGKVFRVGETERIQRSIALAGSQQRVRDFRNLLASLDRTTGTLQSAMDGNVRYTASPVGAQRPKSPPDHAMETIRNQAAQGIAPPASTPPEQLFSVIHEVELEKADVRGELRAAQDEVDTAGRELDALVAQSPRLAAETNQYLAWKRQMYAVEEPLLALRAEMAGKPRFRVVEEPTAPKHALSAARSPKIVLLRGLIASLIGFSTVLAVNGLLRRFAV